MALAPRETDTAYEIRGYRTGDREGFRSLHETVYGSELSAETFDWRYDVPYLDHAPIVVADDGANVVGALALLPSYVRGGDRSVLALQPANAMVHPEHRRRGIYSRIIDRALERYADREPELFFNFPSPAAKGAHENLGWREVGRVPIWYRVHSPSSVLDRGGSSTLGSVLDGGAAALAAAGRRARGRARSDDEIEVRRHDDVPDALLASLYERSVPDELHVARDRRFYAWRYGTPAWDCATYVARRGETPVGAVVAATKGDGDRTTALMESLPLREEDRDPAAVDRLLSSVVRDHRDSTVLRATGSIAPRRLLLRYGFVPNDLPVVSRIATPTEMVARPIDAEDPSGWRVDGRRIDDEDNWRVSLNDQDAPF
jgi:hypothetical protein